MKTIKAWDGYRMESVEPSFLTTGYGNDFLDDSGNFRIVLSMKPGDTQDNPIEIDSLPYLDINELYGLTDQMKPPSECNISVTLESAPDVVYRLKLYVG